MTLSELNNIFDLTGCDLDNRLIAAEEKLLTQAVEIILCTEKAKKNFSRPRWN